VSSESFADLLEGTAEEVFSRERDAPDVWEQLHSLGLTLVGIPEEAGGSGGGLEEAVLVARLAGRHALPVPVADTSLVGAWTLAAAGHDVPSGPVAAVPGLELAGSRLRGRAVGVPWARGASVLAAVASGQVVRLEVGEVTVVEGVNLAGEPLDVVEVPDVDVSGRARDLPAGIETSVVGERGALARAALLVGALERVVDLTCQYAVERQQFGRPIARFQAIQQSLALLAGEVQAARAALDLAARDPSRAHVAGAKLRAGDAAGAATEIAHQVHGAIGYTDEHQLHRFTTRIWSWRDEWGSEEEWAIELGRLACAEGADRLWPDLTGVR
jgi:acyl-CoA dehydrogenase